MGKDGITLLRIDVEGTRFGEWLGLTDDAPTAADERRAEEGVDATAAVADADRPDPGLSDADVSPAAGPAGEPTRTDAAEPGEESDAAATRVDSLADEGETGSEVEGAEEDDSDGRSRAALLGLVALSVVVSLLATALAFLLARRFGSDDADEFEGTGFEPADRDEAVETELAAGQAVEADEGETGEDESGGLLARLPVQRVPAIGDEPVNGDGPRDVRRPAHELAPYVGVAALVGIAALARWSRGEEEDVGSQ